MDAADRQAPAVPRNGRGSFHCPIFFLTAEGVRQTVATEGIFLLYSVGVGVSGEATQQNQPEFIKRSLCRKISERRGVPALHGGPGGEGHPSISPELAEASRRPAAAVADAAVTTPDGSGSSWSIEGRIRSRLLAAGRREAPPSGREVGRRGTKARRESRDLCLCWAM
uniref:Uncharacterized protein n=1 Tax=Oryza punctata TaxID=4537 RepID=A0A0E0LSJ9_ORYPU